MALTSLNSLIGGRSCVVADKFCLGKRLVRQLSPQSSYEIRSLAEGKDSGSTSRIHLDEIGCARHHFRFNSEVMGHWHFGLDFVIALCSIPRSHVRKMTVLVWNRPAHKPPADSQRNISTPIPFLLFCVLSLPFSSVHRDVREATGF
jgi:hypothetical protein